MEALHKTNEMQMRSKESDAAAKLLLSHSHAAAKNYLSFAFTSDFAAMRAWTTARWPLPLASCRGVFPFNMWIVLHRANI